MQQKLQFFKTIKFKIILITILVSLFIGIAISYKTYNSTYRYMTNDLVYSTEKNLIVLQNSVNREVDSLLSLLNWACLDTSISQFTMDTTSSAKTKYKAYETLEKQASSKYTKYMLRLLVSRSADDNFIQLLPTSYSSTIEIPRLTSQSYFEPALNSSVIDLSMGLVSDPLRERASKIVLPIIRPIHTTHSSEVTGFALLQVSSDLFGDNLHIYSDTDINAYLKVGEHYYYYDNTTFIETASPQNWEDYTANYSVMPETQILYGKNERMEETYFASLPLSLPNVSLILSVSTADLNLQKASLLKNTMQVILVAILLGFLIFLYLYFIVNVPVIKIQKRLSHIAQGDFTRDPHIEWQHEFGDIGRGINEMSENISSLIHRKLEDEREKKDYEYQLLQSQINPHFLYNTLNSIKWMATIQNATGIAEMTTALSRLLKNISKGQHTMVTMEEEFHLLDDYFTIQKYRYGGMLSMEYTVENPSLLQAKLPRFSLQPIVENAIFHGIEPKKTTGMIHIHLYEAADQSIQIDITDNGVGMSPEMIAALFDETKGSKSDFFRHLGILSIQKRIQHCFGEAYGLTVTSLPNEYTTMSIHLPPLHYEGDSCHENTNC